MKLELLTPPEHLSTSRFLVAVHVARSLVFYVFVDEYLPFFLVIVLFFYLFTASDYIVLYFYFYNIIGRLQLTQDSAIRYSFGIDNIFLQITAKVQGNMILHYAL